MHPMIIEWDGQNVPEELRHLPPGRYIIYPAESEPPLPEEDLTEEEEAGIIAAIEEIEAGKGIPLQEVMEEVSEEEWLRAASKNPAFEFLKEPEEDIYTPANGKPHA